jgi:5-methylcytosine-specific restriction enzyme subunit McrC
MSKKYNHITIFEHQKIKLHQVIDEVKFDLPKLEALQRFYGDKGVPYYSLLNNGVQFNEYVGVIQVGSLTIEVLPKADNNPDSRKEKKEWRNALIDMLYAAGVFNIHAPSSSNLTIKPNSILDLYFELFLHKVETLLHHGLIKKYRKIEENVTALRGNLQFSKHIQRNLIHQERFYVQHNTYDVEHKLHFILWKTIQLLKRINTNAGLSSRIGALGLHFPEMPDIKVSSTMFEKLEYNRKSEPYRAAIDIAKLLLLQYHPDLSFGQNNILALMFDMNKLWEQFIYASLRKYKNTEISISAQPTKYFWKPKDGKLSKIQPDIVINKGKTDCIVLDTKWKNLNGYNPSPEDLRQMYVYSQYYGAQKVALIYPGNSTKIVEGTYLEPITQKETNETCSVITISIKKEIKIWQREIQEKIEEWRIK